MTHPEAEGFNPSPFPRIDEDIVSDMLAETLLASANTLQDKAVSLMHSGNAIGTFLFGGSSIPKGAELVRAGLYSYGCIQRQLCRDGKEFPLIDLVKEPEIASRIFMESKINERINGFFVSELRRNRNFMYGMSIMHKQQQAIHLAEHVQEGPRNMTLQIGELNQDLGTAMRMGMAIPALSYLDYVAHH